MNDPFLFSVLIPVWNGAIEIEKCLQALEQQSFPRERFEIIVIDNGSTDKTVEVVERFKDVKLLSEIKPGSYAARNTGLASATGTYLAFTDADCIPDRDWLQNAAKVCELYPDVGVFAGQIDLFRSDPADSEVCAAYEQLFFLNQERYARAGGCATANWVSRRTLVMERGGFNAALKSGGDFELAKRISEAGYVIQYAANVVVKHPTRGNVSDVLKKRMRVVGGQWTKQARKSTVRFLAALSYDTMRSLAFVALKGPSKLSIRAGVFCLVAAVFTCNFVEVLRLSGGGEPRRA